MKLSSVPDQPWSIGYREAGQPNKGKSSSLEFQLSCGAGEWLSESAPVWYTQGPGSTPTL